MAVDMKKLHLRAPWQDLTTGMIIAAGGTSEEFHTGEWTAVKPRINPEECRHCLKCVQVCPDSSIGYNKETDLLEVDVLHCKGCGICGYNCPFDAIEMGGM